MKKIEPPRWAMWLHMPTYWPSEAAALTMNFSPETIEEIRGKVGCAVPRMSFQQLAIKYGVNSDEASEYEERREMLTRQYGRTARAVTRAELIDFAHRVGWSLPAELAPPPAEPAIEPAPKALTGNERDKLLKQIGGLALALAKQSGRYTTGEKPNAFQIANEVSSILEQISDANAHGAGTSSLRASIAEGLRLLSR